MISSVRSVRSSSITTSLTPRMSPEKEKPNRIMAKEGTTNMMTISRTSCRSCLSTRAVTAHTRARLILPPYEQKQESFLHCWDPPDGLSNPGLELSRRPLHLDLPPPA
ncbi:hypothetical protein DRJ54_03530 [Candidatus Acetothermia bacterium]|nr:MAG: hypothetical protein DRJ54_03530 [Candidatus Acetothermia bacterium]